MGKQILRGLLAAAMLLGAATASAADKYAVQEHKLAPADSFTPGPELTSGDITTSDAEDPDLSFIDQHAREAEGWTNATLGQELFPRITAGTLLSAVHDRSMGNNAFLERLDLDLYWLQVRLPAIQSQGTQTIKAQAANFDLLLPVELDKSMRLGLLLGTDLGLNGGGFFGQRYQLMYGVSAGPIDLQARAGYGLEANPNSASGLPEFAPATSTAMKQAEILYGAVLGARWASWGRLAVEASGAHLTETHSDLLSLSPGIRLYAGERHLTELGLAALLDFTRSTQAGMDLRGTGGMASVRFNFL